MKHLILLVFLFVAFNAFSQEAGVGKKPSNPRANNLREIYHDIQYPDSAKENGIEGRVVIMVLVNEEGNVIGDKGLVEGNSVFYTEVKKCAYKIKFTPAKMNGSPVKCWVNIPFQFTLANKEKEEN